MKLDLIEVKQNENNNKTKILIIVIIAITFIVVFSLAGIVFAKQYNNERIKKYYLSLKYTQNENVQNIESQQDETIATEQNKSYNLPNYSEKAKEDLNNIYNVDKKIAYLTFDDGPSEAVTPLILDLLKENKKGAKKK